MTPPNFREVLIPCSSSTFKFFSLIVAADVHLRRSATPVQLFQGACVAPQCFCSFVEPPLIYCGRESVILTAFWSNSHASPLKGGRVGVAFVGFSLRRSFQERKSRSLVPLWWCARRHRRAAFISFIQHAALVSSCSTHARNTETPQRNATKPSHFVSLWRLDAAAAASHTAHLKLVLKTLFCCLHSVYMHVCV